ncbi:Arc family DNA-binding protein [Pseudomonas donghuensis]|uniref:Arc family DNA-binding protein n=1 Tax=Pseudomonas donghuensis TaxID=1163398 RepID=UPI001CB8E3F3|nr:Arc family DNA-binding protein [Pseudomonas donghuensis]WKY29632.1 Arc family DNA-binding protein [Pseudomonas donghuensis]
MNSYDSRTADKFVVRLPDGMRDDIQAAADADDRSMNSVFIKGMREYLHGQQQKQVLLGALVLAGRLAPANTSEFDIDEHVKLMADAKRYRWLRGRECIEDAHKDLQVLRGDTLFTGAELDQEIDTAIRLEQLQVQQP